MELDPDLVRIVAGPLAALLVGTALTARYRDRPGRVGQVGRFMADVARGVAIVQALTLVQPVGLFRQLALPVVFAVARRVLAPRGPGRRRRMW